MVHCTYLVCGIGIASSFPFPELSSVAIRNVDLSIREGKVSIGPSSVTSEGYIYDGFIRFQGMETGLLIEIAETGRVWLCNSGEMIVECFSGVEPAEMRFYILGAILGLFLIRKGAFPIHGSTVSGVSGGILFCGASGAGKSTTTAWFMDQGYSLVADDISLVYFSADGAPWVWPGIPQVKLWDDSTVALQRDPETLPRLLDKWDKRRLTVDAAALAGASCLTAIFNLNPEECETPQVRFLSGAERFAAIAGNIYRGETILDLGQGANHFEFVTRLAARTPVFALSRPHDRFALKEIQEIVEHTLNKLYEADTPA